MMMHMYNGTPVEFDATIGYTCASKDLYFEHDRDLQVWHLECKDGGFWDVPSIWPKCVPSMLC